MLNMDDTNGSWIPRERQNSNPFRFTSGHEEVPRNHETEKNCNSAPFKVPEKEATPAPSPRPARRSRKLSLFSFHFNSKEKEDKGKTRRASQPSYNYGTTPSPTTLSAPIELWSRENTVSTGSLNSFSSLDSSPTNSRKCSSVTCLVERENLVIHDIIQETLKLQFENVMEYKREICDRLAKNVCQLVKRRVEVMKEATKLPCKIVSVVYVGAIRDYGIEVLSQALLDSDKDNFTVASYRNGKVFAVGGIMVIPLDN